MIPTIEEILRRYGDDLELKTGTTQDQSYHVIHVGSNSRQRRAKKKSLSVDLVYFATPWLSTSLNLLPAIARRETSDFFVKITITNEVLHGKFTAKKAVHYIPFMDLNGLFHFYNKIQTGKIVDLYLESRNLKAIDSDDTFWDSYIERFEKRIFETPDSTGLYSVSCFEYDQSGQCPQFYSQLSIGYRQENPNANGENRPWQIFCWRLPYVPNVFMDVDEDGFPIERNIFDDKEMVWDSNQMTETFILLTQKELMTVVRKIYQGICSWFDEIIVNKP